MKPIELSCVVLKHLGIPCSPCNGEIVVDESGNYWYSSGDGSYHKIGCGNPFKNEIPGQIVLIDNKIYTVNVDGRLALFDVSK